MHNRSDILVGFPTYNNLWYSVGEDRGAYGDFKNVAANKSITLWMSMHRGLVRLGVLVLTIIKLTIIIL